MSRFLILTGLFTASACLAAPTFAQNATAPSAAAPATATTPLAIAPTAPAAPAGKTTAPAVAKTAAKPDRIVCEDEEEIGTRLGGHRVCKPASAWAAERGEARDEIERSQTNRGVGGPNG